MERKQEARAFLRKQYLAFIDSIIGKDVKLKMTEGESELKAKFEGCDADTSILLVSNLETSLGIQETAKIRVSDVVSLTVTSSPNTDKTN
jgi:small nuclear ribonucleoprotein (snRNP)-like protein